jgi:hypothetical protein
VYHPRDIPPLFVTVLGGPSMKGSSVPLLVGGCDKGILQSLQLKISQRSVKTITPSFRNKIL